MADLTVKRVDEMEAIFGGSMYRARASLGATSFGMQVFDLPPNSDQYPDHNHAGEPATDGQEEVYTALSGKASLLADGEEHALEPGVFARVGPAQKRKIVTGDDGARILAIGAIPGQAYEAPEFTELGGPEPGSAAG